MPPRFPPFDNSLSEDSKVVKLFIEKIQEKIDHKILKKPEKSERKILEDAIFYPGALIGSFVAAASFVGLRKGPVYVMNRMLAKHHANAKLVSTKPRQFQETTTMKIVGSIFDAAFASLLGVTAWFISNDKKKTLTAAASIPLIEGHSEISDALCDDFISIYSGIRPKFWKNYSDDTLTAIQIFVKNCEKRQLYEKKLKREMGLGYEDDMEFELPSRVPDDIIQLEKDRFDGKDWSSLEDFEEPLDNDKDESFWDEK